MAQQTGPTDDSSGSTRTSWLPQCAADNARLQAPYSRPKGVPALRDDPGELRQPPGIHLDPLEWVVPPRAPGPIVQVIFVKTGLWIGGGGRDTFNELLTADFQTEPHFKTLWPSLSLVISFTHLHFREGVVQLFWFLKREVTPRNKGIHLNVCTKSNWFNERGPARVCGLTGLLFSDGWNFQILTCQDSSV